MSERNAEQHEAVVRAVDVERSPHVLITASAGSGKTFQLTNRLMALLHRGVEPDQMLASTFTRKAAGEILGRLLKRLGEAALDDRRVQELKTHVAADLDAPRCRVLLRTLTERLHRTSIVTIDALLMRAATCAGLDLDAPPGWRPAEESQIRHLQDEAIGRVVRRMTDDELDGVLRILSGGSPPRQVLGTLRSQVTGAHRAYRESVNAPEAWEVIGPDSAPLASSEVSSAIGLLADSKVPATAKGAPHAKFAEQHQNLVAMLRVGDWQGVLKHGLIKVAFQPEAMYYSRLVPDDMLALLQALARHAASVLVSQLKEENVATRDLTAAYDVELDLAKRRAGLFEFDDVPTLLYGNPIPLEHLFYRLDATFHHVLLDEFQDTSIEQFAFLQPLLEEHLAQTTDRSVLCVGDVKQSLYAWRRAEPELMERLRDRWPTFALMPLHESYRSSQVVLDAVNQTFGTIATNPALASRPGAAKRWSEWFSPHRAAKNLPGHVRLSTSQAPTGRTNRTTQRAACLALAVDRCEEIRRSAPWATIGILLREKKGMAQLMHMLGQRGIEASLEGGGQLADAPAVLAALSLLHLAEHPGDTLAFFHAAASPLGPFLGITDVADFTQAPSLSRRVRTQLAKEGVERTLRRWKGALADATTARGMARFEQLIALASKFEAEGNDGIEAFTDAVLSARVETPTSSPVRVMTIHASKGLEFDAVILPELFGSMDTLRRQVLVDRDGPFEPIRAVTWSGDKNLRANCDALEEIADRKIEREIRDGLCGLYVAMTRAIHALELIVPPRDTKSTATSITTSTILCESLWGGPFPMPEQTLYEQSRGDWTTHGKSIESAAGIHEVDLVLAPPGRARTGRLARVAPSGVGAGDRLDLSRILRPGPTFGRDRGTLWHAWLARITWLGESLPARQDLLADAAACGTHGLDIASEIATFERSLQDGLAGVLTRERYTARTGTAVALNERPFSVRLDEDEALVTGRFDRLVVGRDERGKALWAEVLDYKTDSAPDEASAQAVADHYRGQIETYRRAAAVMLGLDPSHIGATLVFVGGERVVSHKMS